MDNVDNFIFSFIYNYWRVNKLLIVMNTEIFSCTRYKNDLQYGLRNVLKWGGLMDENALWQSVLNEIYPEVNSASFHAWFNDLKLIRIIDNKVYIQVPMEIHKRILTQNYYSLIDDAFYKLTSHNYEFEFLLKDEIDVSLNQNVDNVDNFVSEVIDTPKKKEKEISLEEWNSNLIPELNFDNYIVGDSNRLAKTAGMIVAEQPGKVHNPLFIYGKSGLGKTHLMHAIGNYIVEHSKKKVLYTTSEMFKDDYINIINSDNTNNIQIAADFKKKYRDVDVLIIDDIQYLVGAEKTQQEFFHTFNALHQANKQIIISSDRSPDDLKLLEERLRSRFMWGLPVDIYPPDFELRCKIIRAKLKNMSISAKIDENVIEYIANNCQNDVRFLEGTLNRLMAYTAMMIPEKVDLNFAIEALADFVNHNQYTTSSIESIQKSVAEYYKIKVEDLKGKKRSANIAYPRMIAMYLSRTLTEENLNRIGLEFGGRDHSTVIHACEKIAQDLKEKVGLESTLKEIQNKL